MIVGGFDGFVHAYDAATGKALWSTATRDHVYASAALLADGTVVVPSADGTVYALDPKTGKREVDLRHARADPLVPAVDGAGNIYFGGGDGVLYVLASNGKLRWSRKLIDQPRKNLNASPALGDQGIYVGGETGEVFGVPYEYCLRPMTKSDANCSTTPPFAGATDGATFLFSEPFGGLDATPPTTLDANQAVAFTLRVRSGGETVLAILDSSSLALTANGQLSPRRAWSSPATDSSSSSRRTTRASSPTLAETSPSSSRATTSLTSRGRGSRSRRTAARSAGRCSGSFKFALSSAPALPFPMPIPAAPGAPSGVFELSRLSFPLPTILPSYNQIGFDSLVYLVGLVEGNGTTGIGWMAGARYLVGQSTPVIDPATQTLLPLVMTYDGTGLLTLENSTGSRSTCRT